MFVKWIRRPAAVAVAALGLAFGAGAAHAAPQFSLALVVDASGSINSTAWNLQRQGYANAINNVLPTDGSVGVSVVRFGSTASIVRSFQTIASAADRTALANFFSGLSQSGNGGTTCISCGIQQAVASLLGNAGTTRTLIDVSTDGSWNTGVNPAGPAGTTGTSRWAVDTQVDVAIDAVNAIGVGTGVAPNFAYGTDSFSLLAANFGEFQNVLEQKLRRETGQVPEPATLALIGAGLAGVGVASRRRRAAA